MSPIPLCKIATFPTHALPPAAALTTQQTTRCLRSCRRRLRLARDRSVSSQCWPIWKHVNLFALTVTPLRLQNNHNSIFLRSRPSNHQHSHTLRHVACHWRRRLAIATVDLLPHRQRASRQCRLPRWPPLRSRAEKSGQLTFARADEFATTEAQIRIRRGA